MARSTKAEVERRVREVSALVCECLTLREIRLYVNAKTNWGPLVSDSSLKYYAQCARALMKQSAIFDHDEELGITKCRIERIIARAAAKGDLRCELAATRQHSELLGLTAPPRSEHSGIDVEAARQRLEEEIAEHLAEEGGDDHDNDPDA